MVVFIFLYHRPPSSLFLLDFSSCTSSSSSVLADMLVQTPCSVWTGCWSVNVGLLGERAEQSLPVGGGAAPGQVVVRARCRARYDRLLHRRHVSRVRLEERGVFAGQHGALVPAKLRSPVLKPNLEYKENNTMNVSMFKDARLGVFLVFTKFLQKPWKQQRYENNQESVLEQRKLKLKVQQLLTTVHSLHHCWELYGAARLFVGWIFVDPDYQKFEEFKILFVFNVR